MSRRTMDPGLRAAPLPWRWPASAALVLALHGAAVILVQRIGPAPILDRPSDAVLIDLAPAEPAPAPVEAPAPQPAPPQPVPPQPAPPPQLDPPPLEPTPVEPVPPEPALPPPVTPALPEAVLPPPRPVPKLPIRRPRPAAARPVSPAPPQPVVAPATAEPVHAAPQAAPAANNAAATASWTSQLAAHLLRFRRYPPDAERRGMTGTVMMRFSVDAAGHVLSASMVQSSGHDTLDEAAAAWLQRAQPLPPPPADRPTPVQIVVPLKFVL